MAGAGVKARLWLAALALLLVATGPAHADPITALIVSALSYVSITGAAATVIATIVSSIIVTAIGIGLQLLFAAKPKTPKPESGTVAVQQSVPYSIFGFGSARFAGAIVLKEESAGALVYVAALARQTITRFTAVFLNDDKVTVAAVGNLLSGTVGTGTDGRYNNVVFIDTRLGAVPETAYANIINWAGAFWGTSYRGDGIASLSMVCYAVKQADFSKNYPYGSPAPSVVADFSPVYDPRDIAQDPANPATWVASKNVALNILNWECFSPFGSRRAYATAIAPVIGYWIQAANDCDDAMPVKAGGTEARYQAGGWTTTEQDRRTTRMTLLQTCDGHIVERGDGTIILRVGKYAAPTVVLTDDDIVACYVQRDVASDEKVNQATAKYTSVLTDYSTVETDPVFDLSDQALRPGPPRSSQIDLPWCQSTGQASRCLAREMIRQKEKTHGKLTVRLSGINACYERWVLVSSNTIPRLNGLVVEIHKSEIKLTAQHCQLDFLGSGPQIDTYTAATDESRPPTSIARPGTVGQPIPQNVSAVATQSTDASGAVTIFLAVSWDEPVLNGRSVPLDYLVQWRLHDAGGGIPGAWTDQRFTSPTIAASRVKVATNTVVAGKVLDVQVSSIATGNSLSTASTIVTVDTSIATSAPGSPTALVATGHPGYASLVCTNPNSANFAAVQFYRAVAGGTFASSTPVGPLQYGSPNAQSTLNDNTAAAGTYNYFATAQNSSAVVSTSAGPSTATIS